MALTPEEQARKIIDEAFQLAVWAVSPVHVHTMNYHLSEIQKCIVFA
jgi:hypothetical protein